MERRASLDDNDPGKPYFAEREPLVREGRRCEAK
jgi:hypothetical protein